MSPSTTVLLFVQMGSGDRRGSQTLSFHHDGSPLPSDREVSQVSSFDGSVFNVLGFFFLLS